MKHLKYLRRYAWRGLIAVALGAVVMAGCSAGDSGDGTVEPFKVRQSFADLQNPAYITVRQTVGDLFAADGVSVDYVATDSMQDPSQQLNDMETFVTEGVDLIIVDPVDEVAIVPGIEAANDAGIPVFLLIKSPAGGEWVSRIYIDQISHANMACEFLASQLETGETVAQLQGIMSVQGYAERSEGCIQALDAAGIEIVAQQEGKGERTESLNVMESILQVNPDIMGVFGANDEEALGAVEAFKAAGIDPGDRVIVGIDGTQVALESMCAGELTATVTDLLADYAAMIHDTSLLILADQSVEAEQELKGRLTSVENLAEIIKLTGYEIDSCPAAN